MRILSALIAAAFFIAAPAAHATELWQGAEAGDSAQELLAKFENAERHPDPETLESGATCDVWIEKIEVVGEPFQACFYILNGELVQVMLTLTDEPSARKGQAIFESIFNGLRERYGAESSVEREDGLLTIYNADWFGEELELNLILVYVGDGEAMALNVNYRPAKDVDTSNL